MISIIVPVYNGEQWIEKCIKALKMQSIYNQLEIIFIDDGSTDSTGELLDEYVSKEPYMTVHHIQNNGVSNARNVGMSYAHGKYIAFFDVDDYIEPDYYAVLLEHMDEECDIVCGGYIVDYPNQSVCCKSRKLLQIDYPECVKEYLQSKDLDPNIWDKLFRRSSILDVFFDTSLVQSEDRYFCFQCMKKARRIRIIPEAKYHYRVNPSSAIQGAFSDRKLDSCIVADHIIRETAKEYPQFLELAECYGIDIKTRIVGEMVYKNAQKQFGQSYRKIYGEIRKFSILKKAKYSSKKHMLAFGAMKIHPKLYVKLKYDSRLQYR